MEPSNMGTQDKITRREALLGASGLLAASGLASSVPLTLGSPALAQDIKPKMATEIPPEITTPDRVETRLGSLNFFDGVPDKATCEKLYENLDLMRGIEVFLNTMAAASTHANLVGLRGVGCDNHTVLIHEDRVDAKTLLLTPNTQTATLWAALDLTGGPVVVEIPPGVLGLADDHWMRHITDMGLSGPDQGKGGKYIFLPPGYQGQTPEGYFVGRPRTFNIACGLRGFTIKGETGPAVKAFSRAVQDVSVRPGRRSTAHENHQRLRSLSQHHPCQHIRVLRRNRSGCSARACVSIRARDRRAIGGNRDR
jgi:hypothetical protein